MSSPSTPVKQKRLPSGTEKQYWERQEILIKYLCSNNYEVPGSKKSYNGSLTWSRGQPGYCVTGTNFRSGLAYFQNFTLSYFVNSDIEAGSSSTSCFFWSFLIYSDVFLSIILSSILPVKLNDLNTIFRGNKGEGRNGGKRSRFRFTQELLL